MSTTTTTEDSFTILAPRQRRRTPTPARDPDGTPIVRVEVPGMGIAEIELEAFNRIMERGFSDQWFAHDNGRGSHYVAVAHPTQKSKTVPVAHLVVQREGRRHVRFFDGNRLNLRKRNLWQKGMEEQQARDANGNPLTPEAQQRANHWMPAGVNEAA